MKHLLSILLLFSMTVVNAQTILKGDMNDDKDVNIADVTSLVDVVLGKAPKETISIGSPYMVDNSYVVGTWYAPDGTSFTLNEDGTTDYPDAATYKFRPYQGSLMMFTASGAPIKTLVLNEVESDYLLAVDYTTGIYTYYTNSNSLATGITLSQTSLTMNSGTATQLTATLSPEGSFGNMTWISSDESVATVDANGIVTAVAGGNCTITATVGGSLKTATCVVSVIQMVTSIMLSQNKVVIEKLDDFVRLTATILPENAANKNVVWSSSNEDVAMVRNGRVDAYGYGSAIITCEAADGSGIKDSCVVLVPGFVDLGLPSGTLWATCNIGAYCPEDYGDYFAWGETLGYLDGKSVFNWITYKWCNGTYDTQNKYSADSNSGFVDNKKELDCEDDAAYVQWGEVWRTPSSDQLVELFNSSYIESGWTMINGIPGMKITRKKNGNSLFLPAGYCKDHQSSVVMASGGYYWSRSLCIEYPSLANARHFDSTGISMGYYSRCQGFCVRPVRVSE